MMRENLAKVEKMVERKHKIEIGVMIMLAAVIEVSMLKELLDQIKQLIDYKSSVKMYDMISYIKDDIKWQAIYIAIVLVVLFGAIKAVNYFTALDWEVERACCCYDSLREKDHVLVKLRYRLGTPKSLLKKEAENVAFYATTDEIGICIEDAEGAVLWTGNGEEFLYYFEPIE